MDYPIEFPPQEIIKTLEKDLDSKFSHFTVSLDGNVEGIFIHHITQEPISIVFEIKRKALDTKTEMDIILQEMDDTSLEHMRTFLESILDEIEVKLSKKEIHTINYNELDEEPEYDNWYCP